MENNERYVRSKEDLCATMNSAKLKPSQMKNPVQVIYCQKKDSGNIKLLELDKHMEEALIQGQRDDRALLCTDSRTYAVEEAETSNSLVLCPKMKFSSEITGVLDENIENLELEQVTAKGIFYTYFETTHCKPELGKLIPLLEPTSFKGPEYEKQMDKNSLYTWSQLCCKIQASEKELKEAMAEYMIVNMNGYYRLISFEFESKSLTMMLDFMEENSWTVDQVNKEETYEALNKLIPKPIFDMVFHKYTTKNDDNSLYKYDGAKVCKFLAQVLLAGSPVNEFKLFMEAWKMGVPEGITPKLEYLHGIAVIVWNNEKARKEVVSFPESKLSENITERFKELFRVKDKWMAEEISPYIK